MTTHKLIANLDELFAYTAAVIEGAEDYKPIQITATSLAIPLRICGPGWDGRIDTRVARYVIDLQSSADDLLQDCGYDIDIKGKPQVHASIKNGSTELVPDLIEVVKVALTNMTPEQTFILLSSGLAAITGLTLISRILTHRSENQALSTHEETKRQMLDVISKQLDERQMASYEKPTRSLVTRAASADDRLLLEGEKIDITEARKMFPRQKKSEQTTSYADGEYLLTKIDYSLGELLLFISQNGHEIKAFTSQLSEEDQDKLFQEIATRQKTEALPLPISLQLNVHHTTRKFKYGSVIGIGKPRQEKQQNSLADIFSKFL